MTVKEELTHCMPNTRKKPKNMLVWQVMTLQEVGENHAFCKKSWLDS
jgi:hypothetical protein